MGRSSDRYRIKHNWLAVHVRLASSNKHPLLVCDRSAISVARIHILTQS